MARVPLHKDTALLSLAISEMKSVLYAIDNIGISGEKIAYEYRISTTSRNRIMLRHVHTEKLYSILLFSNPDEMGFETVFSIGKNSSNVEHLTFELAEHGAVIGNRYMSLVDNEEDAIVKSLNGLSCASVEVSILLKELREVLMELHKSVKLLGLFAVYGETK